ncbi:MAG: hypothetical protein P1U30_08285 [Phycisphaerales bacterium]|nr:hypothetical protein [Phycisphaerales bacterium]
MKSCVLLAIAGFASCALGQVATMDMVADGVWDGDNRMTLSVFVDSDYSTQGFDPTHVLVSTFSLEAIGENSTVEEVSLLESPGWQDDGFLFDEGYDGEGGHAGFSALQRAFVPFVLPDEASSLAEGPVFVASFEMILSEPITSETELGWRFAAYDRPEDNLTGWWPLEMIDIYANPAGVGGESRWFFEDDIEMGTFYIPSPSGFVLLGLGGFFAGRRRRDGLERSL